MLLSVKFKTNLSLEQLMEIVNSRADEFRGLSGLQQKYYLQEMGTGEYGGLYLWESSAALNEYRESALRASIAEAFRP